VKVVRPVRAALGDVPALVEVAVAATGHLPVVRWLVGSGDRDEVVAGAYRVLLGHAMLHGWVDTVTDRSAVAVWLPGDCVVAEVEAWDRALVRSVGRHIDRFRRLVAVMVAAHPVVVPHQHLALLAVVPSRQGQGVGVRLLRHRFRQLDRGGIATYVAAPSVPCRDFFARHGFGPIGAPFGPGACTASSWPMWRPAGAAV
jgi:GNAT superfamily N-acetyltransferase